MIGSSRERPSTCIHNMASHIQQLLGVKEDGVDRVDRFRLEKFVFVFYVLYVFLSIFSCGVDEIDILFVSFIKTVFDFAPTWGYAPSFEFSFCLYIFFLFCFLDSLILTF